MLEKNNINHALITTRINLAQEKLIQYIRRKDHYGIFYKIDDNLKNLLSLLNDYNIKYNCREEIEEKIKNIIEKKRKILPKEVINSLEIIFNKNEDLKKPPIANEEKNIIYVYLYHSKEDWLSSIKNNLLADKKVLYGLCIHTEKKVSILNKYSILVELCLDDDQIFHLPSSNSDNPEAGKRIFITSVNVENIRSYTTSDGTTTFLSYNENGIIIAKNNNQLIIT